MYQGNCRTQRGYATDATYATTMRGSGFPGQKLATDLVYQLGFSVTPLVQRVPSRCDIGTCVGVSCVVCRVSACAHRRFG